MLIEIRLMIYSHLLSPQITSHERGNRPQDRDPRQAPVCLKRDREHPGKIWVPGLVSQILSVCRKINQEAIPMLYRNNYFIFHNEMIRSTARDQVPSMIEEKRKIFMSYPLSDWPEHVPEPIWRYELAIFLYRIGPANAANIREIEFASPFVPLSPEDVLYGTALLAQNTPALETFGVSVHPVQCSSSWATSDLPVLYTALKNGLLRLPWVKNFKYQCYCSKYPFCKKEFGTKLLELKEFVCHRAAERQISNSMVVMGHSTINGYEQREYDDSQLGKEESPPAAIP
ncbi:MAG: hypothetical protein Q9220_003367 [cf. Caloplaca sp. 1 TL-2023]